jgi:predicted CXXCH cytochrome family protein
MGIMERSGAGEGTPLLTNLEEIVMDLRLRKFSITKKSLLFSGLVSLGLASAGSAWAGTIVGSKHDLSAQGWSGGEICVVCHTPHNADVNVTDAPLWNHTVTTANHTMYSSATFDGNIIGGPTGASKLCLSCHDGTVAIDSFGGAVGNNTLQNPKAILGADLSNDHPISFVYDDALATADGALAVPTTTTVTIGEGADGKTGLLADLMLPSGQLECSSCHDVHNKFAVANTKLLRVSNASSGLCLTCHTK